MGLTIRSQVRLNDGQSMPLFGFGTFRLTEAPETRDAVLAALEIGYRLIDTAAVYANEAEVGEGVKLGPVAREELFITTKVWNNDQGYDETLVACHNSLRVLGMDYVDLYLIHWPVTDKWQGSWRAMEELRAQGLCRSIGVSNFSIAHLEELRAMSNIIPAVNQVEFHPFAYQRDLLQYCQQQQILLEAYSPLTRGGKLDHTALVALAEKYHKTPAQILLRWPLQHGIAIIPKSSHPDRIRENADIFDFELSAGDMAMLDDLNEDYYGSSHEWRAQFGL